jgi:hypothetical protein
MCTMRGLSRESFITAVCLAVAVALMPLAWFYVPRDVFGIILLLVGCGVFVGVARHLEARQAGPAYSSFSSSGSSSPPPRPSRGG